MPIGVFKLNTIAKGVAAIGSGSLTATGGSLITYYNNGTDVYRVHLYNNIAGTYNFIVSAITGSPQVDVLLVGGGGAAGGMTNAAVGASGGGAGGTVIQSSITPTVATYPIIIGGGGAGVSANNGSSGGSTTGFSLSATGGAGGTMASASTNGAGAGTNSTVSNSATVGSYSFKGGNSFGSATTTARAGGGGAGWTSAGTNATTSTGGNGGLGISTTSIIGPMALVGSGATYTPSVTYYLANGGGGGGATPGTAYSGAGSGAVSTTSSSATYYGSGGGGIRTTSAVAATGGSGYRGFASVRYKSTRDYAYLHYYLNGGAVMVTPDSTQAAEGDFAIVISKSSNTTTGVPPTGSIPSGWTSIADTNVIDGTVGLRIVAYYKKLTVGDLFTSITNPSTGSTSTKSMMFVYRTNKANITISQVSQEASSIAIAQQNLTMATGLTQPYIAFNAVGTSTNSAATASSTVTPSRTVFDTTTTPLLGVKTFDAVDSGVSFANSAFGMVDGGTQSMVSFIASFS